MSAIEQLGLGSIPRWTNWEYANAAARTGATGFAAFDVGKIAKQTDNSTYWELTAVTPTWVQVGGNSSIQISISIGAEDGNQITAALQVQDPGGASLSGIYMFTLLLADTNTEPILTATAPNTLFESAEGNIVEYVSGKMIEVFTATDGSLNVDIGETGTGTWYLWIKLPNGETAVSSAITFA